MIRGDVAIDVAKLLNGQQVGDNESYDSKTEYAISVNHK